MKESKHEMLKAQWKKLIKEQSESDLSIRDREEALIKAGTLAVTGQTQFVELNLSITDIESNNHGTCAILRSNGTEIEIFNGADPNTLALVLNLIGK